MVIRLKKKSASLLDNFMQTIPTTHHRNNAPQRDLILAAPRPPRWAKRIRSGRMTTAKEGCCSSRSQHFACFQLKCAKVRYLLKG
jgi:hypothetical protein